MLRRSFRLRLSVSQCRLAHVTSIIGDKSSQMPHVLSAFEIEVSQHMSTVTQPLQCWSSAGTWPDQDTDPSTHYYFKSIHTAS